MNIKEVSNVYGLSADTLRYYERIGIIPAVTRTENGIRNYSDEDLCWVALAAQMKDLEFSIEMMLRHVEYCSENNMSPCLNPEMLSQYREVLIEKRNHLNETLIKIEETIQLSRVE